MTISLFSFPLFSSQGLAAHGSCNSLCCCHCPLSHVKEQAVSFRGINAPSCSLVNKVHFPPHGPLLSVCKPNPASLPWEQPEVPVCLPIGPKEQTDRGERIRRARLDPVLARVWGGSCNATREQQNQPLCGCLLGFNGSAPVWRCWCEKKVRDEPCLPLPHPLPLNQDWSGGTDYICKNNLKGVSTASTPLP